MPWNCVLRLRKRVALQFTCLRFEQSTMELSAYNSRQHKQIQLQSSAVSIGSDDAQVDWKIDDPRISPFQFSISVETLELEKSDTSNRASRQTETQTRVILKNHGRSIILSSGRRVHGGHASEIEIPALFWIGETCFSVQPSMTPSNVESLATLPSFNGDVTGEELAKILGKSPAATTLIHWFQSIGLLQRSVGGSKEFFADAAHAVFDPGGLDSGMIITVKNGQYEIATSFISNPELGIGFERDVVQACVESGKTVFHDVQNFEDPDCKLRHAVVASPIFDHRSKLIGVVYGSRCRHRNNFRQGIRPLEAQFIQVVSECVTAGMVRLAQEAEAARTRVQFEQVFSPKLVETLQRDPSILDGHEREVTVMFCDMRASTVITEQLPPREVYNVLADVMDQLTEKILQHEGVVIDYYGDGLAAFWNAPVDQENHASLAVRAGLDIIDSLPEINNDWRQVLGRNIQVGIGINTGVALIGNSGSRWRLKYGPRGKNVNIACRIEGATKDFGIPILISESTCKKIEKDFVTRRVFSSQLAGFNEQFDLYQPFDTNMDVRELERLRNYESALKLYQQGEFLDSIERLLEMEMKGCNDAAIEYLLKANRNAMKQQIPTSEDLHRSHTKNRRPENPDVSHR